MFILNSNNDNNNDNNNTNSLLLVQNLSPAPNFVILFQN